MKYILVLLITSVSIIQASDDVIFRAMNDELSRSMNELKIDGLEKPYFVEYKLEVVNPYSIEASLGSLISSDNPRTSRLNVAVRVGDYKFDNSNFFDFGLNFFGSSDDEERFKRRIVAIDPDYNTLRRELWLSTDAAYKQAAELYSKKIASLKNKIRKDTTHDLLRMDPVVNILDEKAPDFEWEKHEKLVQELSKIYLEYSNIQSSNVNLEYIVKDVYYLNSEGTKYKKTTWYTGLESVATGQAEDGMPMANFFTSFSNDPEDLPSLDSLKKSIRNCAENLSNGIKIDAILDDYSGPVLFSKRAAAEIFAQNFAPNFVTQREPVSDASFGAADLNKAFQTKIGGRVLPEFLSVKDSPMLKFHENSPIFGNYQLDDNGEKAQEVILVKDGYLKNLLSERIPTKRVRKSNGHKREGAAMFSNLIVEANDRAVSYDSLKKRMMELCKDRELEYGIVVKNIMNKNVFITTMYRQNPGLMNYPRGAGKFIPTEIYKVYADGREELIRGYTGKAFTVRSFKDIILVGNKTYSYNLLANAVISPFVSGGGQYVKSSITIPDLLFEDGEFVIPTQDFKKIPILTNPIGKN